MRLLYCILGLHMLIWSRGDEENEKEDLEEDDGRQPLDFDGEPPANDDILNLNQHSGYNLRSRQVNQIETEDF